MSISKILGFMILAVLMISSAMAQSPSPAPSKIPTPKASVASPPTQSPKSSVASPPTPSQAVSPSTDSTTTLSPSSISDSPAQAPGPAQSNAISNRYAVFGGSVAVFVYAAVLAL